MLRAPRSKELKTTKRSKNIGTFIVTQLSEKSSKTAVLSDKILQWADNKASSTDLTKSFLMEKHQLKIKLMQEKHEHELQILKTESETRIQLIKTMADKYIVLIEMYKSKLTETQTSI